MNKIINSDKILSFLLGVLVFVLLVDPTNTILKVKDIVFVFFVTLSAIHYARININALIVVLIIYFIVVLTFIIGYFSNYQFDYGFTLGILKGFSPLVLMFWIDKYKLIDKMIFPSLIVSVIVILTFLAYVFTPGFAQVIYTFYARHDNTMIIARRSFLGINVLQIFYKSLPVLLLPAAFYVYKYFNENKERAINFLFSSLLILSLFFGGTRASMLAAILIIVVNLYLWMLKYNFGRLLLIPTFLISMITFCFLFISLISEKEEASNKVKIASIVSYSDLFEVHPQILLFGQGAGSLFYSKGRHSMVVQTELSYLEFIRMFGLFGAAIIVLIFLFPLYIIYRKRKKMEYWIPMTIGYFLYLLVGGTNPLLLGSTGMLVLLAAYSYALNPYYERSRW